MSENKITIDDLAAMVQQGFMHMEGKFDEVNSRFDQVNTRLDSVENRLASLERGQEDIKLRQDNSAYRFELDDLRKRVERLEHAR